MLVSKLKYVLKILLIFDKKSRYEEARTLYNEARTLYNEIDTNIYQPKTFLENLLLVENLLLAKYELDNISTTKYSVQEKNKVTNKIYERIKEFTFEEVKTLLLENNDPDFYYLIGSSHHSHKNMKNTYKYFHKAVSILEQGGSLLIKENSLVVFEILRFGVIKRYNGLVKNLLDKVKQDADWVPSSSNLTLLYLASEDLQTDISKILLEKGANPFFLNPDTMSTPLLSAINVTNFKFTDNVKERIIKGILKVPSHEGESPIDYYLDAVSMWCSYDKQAQFALDLSVFGYEDSEFQVVFTEEKIRENIKIISYEEVDSILSTKNYPDFYYLTGLSCIARQETPKALKHFKSSIKLISDNNSLLIKPDSYACYHMLCIGIIEQDTELVKTILDKIKHNVDWLPPDENRTLLFISTTNTKTDISEILLQKGANPFFINKETRQTPVHRAINLVNFPFLEKVLETKPIIPDHKNEEPIDLELDTVEMMAISNQIYMYKLLNKLGYTNTEFQITLSDTLKRRDI